MQRRETDNVQLGGFGLLGAKLLADPVYEQLDSSAPGAHVHVEMLSVHEEFTDPAKEERPGARPLVEPLGSHELEFGLAPRARHWVGCQTHQPSL